MGLNESGDVGLEFLDTAMDAALDLLVGEQREPAFDLIKPGGAGRRKMRVTAGWRVSLALTGGALWVA